MSFWSTVEHGAADLINAPIALSDSIAHHTVKAFNAAGDAFRDEAHDLLSAGKSIVKFADNVEKQGKLLGEGLVTGAVLNPINGVRELVNIVPGVHLPKLEFSNQAEVDKSWAGKIGMVGGTAADFVLTAGAVSSFAGAEASSALTLGKAGAIQGGLLTPTSDRSATGNTLVDRLETAAIGGAGGAAMGGVVGKVESSFTGSVETMADRLKVRAVTGLAGGIANVTVKGESRSILQRGQLSSPFNLGGSQTE